MIAWIAVAAAALACALPAALALGPNVLIQPESRMTLFTDGYVEIRDRYGHETVHIWGTFEDDGSDKWLVIIQVTDPDGGMIQQEFEVRGTRYDTYHALHGSDIRLEGWYTVEAHVNNTVPVHIGTAEFYADVLGYERPDIRLDITNSSAYVECVPACYDIAIGDHEANEYEIVEGGTVEWNNRGLNTHHIYSQAIGYGGEMPLITTEVGDGPNEFDTNILQIGATIQVTFDEPGTVLFTCLFHPWMEGLLIIRAADGEPDGEDLDDRPSGVADILEHEEIEAEEDLAEEIASSVPDETGDVNVADVESTSLSLSLDASDSADLFGGLVEVRMEFSEPHRYRITVKMQDENDTSVESIRTKTAENGTALVAIPVQPTWDAGTYMVTVFNSRSLGIPSVSASEPVEITGENPCLGDAGASQCFAGFVEQIRRDDKIVVDGKRTSLAFIDARDVRDAISSVCMPGGEGAVAVVDIDMLDDRRAGTVWCGGTMVNAMVLDGGNATLREEGCAEGETAERLAAYCAAKAAALESQRAKKQDSLVGGDCPIALVSYGNHLAVPVQEMREVRQGLVSAGHGWLLDGIHAAYYTAAPHAADILRDNDGLRNLASSYLSVPIIAGAWLL